jgi:hypothetical protein
VDSFFAGVIPGTGASEWLVVVVGIELVIRSLSAEVCIGSEFNSSWQVGFSASTSQFCWHRMIGQIVSIAK